MCLIYVLNLEENKYFIGKTNLTEFILDKFDLIKYEFTMLYNPISIEKIYYNCTDEDLHIYVQKYMILYGIDNVRGGKYNKNFICNIDLNKIQEEINYMKLSKEQILKEYTGLICYKCGRIGHAYNICKEIIHLDGSIIKLDRCNRCGKKNHWITTCKENYDLYGRNINKENNINNDSCIIS